MIKLDSVSEQTEQGEQREGYVFHCHNCGVFLMGLWRIIRLVFR